MRRDQGYFRDDDLLTVNSNEITKDLDTIRRVVCDYSLDKDDAKLLFDILGIGNA